MRKPNYPSIIVSLLLILLLVVNLILLAFSKIDVLLFWLILIIAGLIAYKGLPLLKK